MERKAKVQGCTKTLSYNSFSLASLEAFYNLSKSEADLIPQGLNLNQHRADLWLSAGPSVDTLQKTVTTVPKCTILNQKNEAVFIRYVQHAWKKSTRLFDARLVVPLRTLCMVDQKYGGKWTMTKSGQYCSWKAFKDRKTRKYLTYVMVETICKHIAAISQRKEKWSPPW